MRHRTAALSTILLIAGLAAPRPAAAQTVGLAPDTSWVRRSALYEVFVRDFSPSGDFPGVTQGLDRIQASGANTVWLMPIHPVGVEGRKGTLGSSYAATDYYAINPAYGTADDLHALIAAIHARGMKVILDWVPDHTSPDAVWVHEHPDWYVHDAQGRPAVPADPAGHPTDWTDVVQLDYGNPAMRAAMIEVMRWWLQQFDIDGYRVDVAGFIPYDFWREAIPALRASVPRPILMLAENGEFEMHRAGFDLTYGWGPYARLKAVWRGAAADSFVLNEVADLRMMPPGGMRLRFTTNHDETAWDNPPVTLFGGRAGARAAFVATALLPGRPLLYDGQEVESPQKLALFEREAIDWNQPGAATARRFYRHVIELARGDSTFLTGDFARVETSAPHDVIAYRRAETVILVNTRNQPVRFTVTDRRVSGTRDLLTGHLQRGETVALPAWGAVILRSPHGR